ncbi:hypothetical protein PtB15_5B313 [Puccinia triticina]|nr:hypothetical protein PtB15_5B313 [Puccinia triticina]
MNAKREFTVVKRASSKLRTWTVMSNPVAPRPWGTWQLSPSYPRQKPPQLIFLTKQQGILCPVAALRRRLSGTDSSRTFLFGYLKGGKWFHLTKKDVLSWVRTALAQKGHAGILGHSFCVGGALLRLALGMSVEDVCTLGRWTSR